MENNIVLKQKPIIEHQLSLVGASVTERIAALNLGNLIATIDTIQTLRDTRATLRKEHAEYEGQRKKIHTAVSEPYAEFKKLYEAEISTKYSEADKTLGSTISKYELKLKADRATELEQYFNECAVAYEIDFIKFSQMNMTISAAQAFSMKSQKKKVVAWIDKIQEDLNLIETQEHKAEILVEYKKDLQCSRAITSVVERKAKEKEEADRLKELKYNKRRQMLVGLSMKFEELTQSYIWGGNQDIFIHWETVKDFTDAAFEKQIFGVKIKISNYQAAQKQEQQIEAAKQQQQASVSTPAPEVKKTSVSAPVSAPVQQPKTTQPEKKMIAYFQVEGTRSELLELSAYLKSKVAENKLTYTNIKKENILKEN